MDILIYRSPKDGLIGYTKPDGKFVALNLVQDNIFKLNEKQIGQVSYDRNLGYQVIPVKTTDGIPTYRLFSAPQTISTMGGGGGGKGVGGNGTLNFIAKFTPDGSHLGDSQLYDNGTSIGYGTTSPVSVATFDIQSTSKGFLVPRMTVAQRNAILTPVDGLLVYVTDIKLFSYWDSGAVTWQNIDSQAGGDVSGSGTTSRVTKWTDGPNSVIGDSDITDSGAFIGFNSTTASSTERFRFGTGNLLINDRAVVGADKFSVILSGVATDVKFGSFSNTVDATIALGSASAVGALGANIIALRSRGTITVPTIVSNNDNILDIYAYAFDGTDYEAIGIEKFEMDGVPAFNDTPGRYSLWTTPAGSTTPVKRFTVDSTGWFGINVTTPFGTEKFAVSGDAYIDGKLTVTGALDPTSVLLSGGTALYFESNDGSTAPVSGAATGRIRYLDSTGKWQVSVQTGAYEDIITTSTSVNIYTADGSLAGNRIVTQGANTLAFTATAVNAFSVDGTTFSVDALNNRVGVGTAAPTEPLEINNATAANLSLESAGGAHNFYFKQSAVVTGRIFQAAFSTYMNYAGDRHLFHSVNGTTGVESFTISLTDTSGLFQVLDASANPIITAGHNPAFASQKVGIRMALPTASLHVVGEGATSATYSLKIENSASTPALYVSDDVFTYASKLAFLNDGTTPNTTAYWRMVAGGLQVTNEFTVQGSGTIFLTGAGSQGIIDATSGNKLVLKGVARSLTIQGSSGAASPANNASFYFNPVTTDGSSGTERYGMYMAYLEGGTNGGAGISSSALAFVITDNTTEPGTLYGINITNTAGTNTAKTRVGGYFTVSGSSAGNFAIQTGAGNILFGATAIGTNAEKVLGIGNGTAPTTSPADMFQLYSADVVPGNAAAHFRTENGAIIKIYQETTAVAAAAFVANTSGILNDTATFGGYTLGQVVGALQAQGLLQ